MIVTMAYTTLISTVDLASHLTDPDCAIFDCRFSLADAERGRRDYSQAHIPGAAYAHLNEDLSGLIVRGKTGRHPLPAVDVMAQRLSNWGIDDRTQVIAYDDTGGSMAARVWWLLRWLGHDAVAVLDGGWQQWLKENREVTSEIVARSPRLFTPRPRPEMVMTSEEVAAIMNDRSFKLFDSRTTERYRGETEPFDPIAGHIPGAISAPYAENLAPDLLFRSTGDLRQRFDALLGDTPADQTAFYCGSGINAAHNVLALKHVGLGDARLYAGSWSEWITDPTRPIATGNENA
jgi:thiosulfate/3-mercaptopyruvate sulfurtransferase